MFDITIAITPNGNLLIAVDGLPRFSWIFLESNHPRHEVGNEFKPEDANG